MVFHSPIFVREVVGRDLAAIVFAGSAAVREEGYTDEYKPDDRTTFLRWQGTIDGKELESLEVIVDDDNGLVAERTIAHRPYPALKIFRDRGVANPALKKFFPDDLFDYPENLAKHQVGSEVG